MTPEEFAARATAAVATVEPDVTSYAWLTRNVTRRARRRRVVWIASAAVVVAMAGVSVLVVPRVARTPVASFPPPVHVPAIDGDVDGDGLVDDTTIAYDDETRPDRWAVRARLSSGRTLTTAWQPLLADTYYYVMSVLDMNHDGRSEVLVGLRSSRGGGDAVVVAALARNHLDLVHLAGGKQPFLLRNRGSEPGVVYAWGCADDDTSTPEWEVYTVEIAVRENLERTGVRRWYALHGATLRQVGSSEQTWRVRRIPFEAQEIGGPPGFDTQVHCGSII